MITTTEAYKQAIKANVVRARAKMVFNYATPLAVNQVSIISISVQQRGESTLGCLQDDKLNIELKSDTLTNEQYGQDVTVKVYLGCEVNGNDEIVCIGTFKVLKWNKTDHTIQLELGSNTSTNNITEVLAAQDVLLSEYIVSAVSKLMGETITIGSIVDGTLGSAYLYYRTIKEQLKAFAFASGGIMRYREGLELMPYKFGTPVAVYKEGPDEMILDKSGNSTDLVTTKQNYSLVRSVFTKEEDTTLYSATGVRITEEYIPHEFNFSGAGLVKYFNFKKLSYFSTPRYGLFGGSIALSSGYGDVTKYIDFSIIGTKILSTAIATVDDTVSYLSNPYIQTSAQVNVHNLAIYNGEKYSFKSRIDPSLQIGDTITVFRVGEMLVTGMSYKFDGGLSGTIEGVLINGEIPEPPKVISLLVPNLTSNNDNGYVVESSGYYGNGYEPYRAFNLSIAMTTTGGFWASKTSTNAWISIKLPDYKTVTKIALTSRYSFETQNPKSFVLQGSNDKTTWIDLLTISDIPAWTSQLRREWGVNNTTKYIYYRVYVYSNTGGVVISIGKIELYGY